MVLIILLYALFASTFSISKTILGVTSPCLLVGIRMTVAGLLLALFQLCYHPSAMRIHKRDLFLFLQTGFFSIGLAYCTEFWGMRYLPSFKTCTLFGLGPFVTYLIACMFFNEPVRITKWIGLTIGFLGLVPVLLTSSNAENLMGSLLAISWPEFFVIVGVISYSYGWFLVKKLVQLEYNAITINAYSMFIGGLLSLSAAAVFEQPWQISDPKRFVMLISVSMLVGNIICYNLYTSLLHRYSTTLLSFASVLTPLFAAFYGWLFLSEQITWHFFASMSIVAIGLLVFYHEEFSRPAT